MIAFPQALLIVQHVLKGATLTGQQTRNRFRLSKRQGPNPSTSTTPQNIIPYRIIVFQGGTFQGDTDTDLHRKRTGGRLGVFGKGGRFVIETGRCQGFKDAKQETVRDVE